jgi:hypothetical protein
VPCITPFVEVIAFLVNLAYANIVLQKRFQFFPSIHMQLQLRVTHPNPFYQQVLKHTKNVS